MSPKSTIPVIRPSSSTSALSVVRSRVDDLRAQRRPDRRDDVVESVEHALDQRSRSASVADRRRSSSRGPRRVLDVPEHRPTRARVEEPPQRPTEPRRRLAPGDERGVGEVARPSIRPRPGSTSYIRDVMAPSPAATARDGRRIRAVGAAPGTSQGIAPAAAPGRPARRADGERLHVERRGVLGGVRELHDRDRSPPRRGAGTSGRARCRGPGRRPRATPNVRAAISTASAGSNAGRAVARTASNSVGEVASMARPMVAG